MRRLAWLLVLLLPALPPATLGCGADDTSPSAPLDASGGPPTLDAATDAPRNDAGGAADGSRGDDGAASDDAASGADSAADGAIESGAEAAPEPSDAASSADGTTDGDAAADAAPDAPAPGDAAPETGAAACNGPSDCRLYSSYCHGTVLKECTCVPLGAGDPDPACDGPIVSCFVDPCSGKSASCGADHRCAAN
jgi:hypothetical protein